MQILGILKTSILCSSVSVCQSVCVSVGLFAIHLNSKKIVIACLLVTFAYKNDKNAVLTSASFVVPWTMTQNWLWSRQIAHKKNCWIGQHVYVILGSRLTQKIQPNASKHFAILLKNRGGDNSATAWVKTPSFVTMIICSVFIVAWCGGSVKCGGLWCGVT